MGRRLSIAACVLAGTLAALPADAREVRRGGASSPHTALGKLGRGLAGMTTGFLELPGNIYAISRDDGPGSGWTIGFAKGLGMIPVRTLVGVYEFLTAPIPAPAEYGPIILPDYPWGYFDGAPSARFAL